MAERRRIIANTETMARHPWPEDLYVQGGDLGVVMSPKGNYRTAFVEAFPGTFLRGEGATVTEAEDACWAQYQRYLHCDGNGPHGPMERRGYRNGGAICGRCGVWMGCVLDELPDDDREPSLLERALDHDGDALAEIFTTMANADALPTQAERPQAANTDEADRG